MHTHIMLVLGVFCIMYCLTLCFACHYCEKWVSFTGETLLCVWFIEMQSGRLFCQLDTRADSIHLQYAIQIYNVAAHNVWR